MRYAIYGAGSLGTVLGAYITKSGTPIDLINRNQAHVDALNHNGAHIVGEVDMTVPVHALTPDQMTERYDVIILLTKQTANPQVLPLLKEHLTQQGVVATLQNGIPEPSVAQFIGQHRTIGVIVEWGATLEGPGVSRLTSSPEVMSFHMGKMEGVSDQQLDTVKQLLEKMCPVVMEDDLIGVRWSKLLINATFSGLGTVIGGTFGDVADNQKAREVAVRCIKECIDVAKSAGIRIPKVQGKDITRLFYYTTPLRRGISKLFIGPALKNNRDIEPSMLQDLKKGKHCEIDAINGVVCQWGRQYSCPTPVNDRIVAVVKQEEAGQLPLAASNIDLFDDIIRDVL